MTQKVDPFIAVNWGWEEGEDGWGEGMNQSLITYDFYHNRRIDGTIASASLLPVSPDDGEAYFSEEDNNIYFRADSVWWVSKPPIGMKLILKSTEVEYRYDGTALVIDTLDINDIDGLQDELDSKLDDTLVGVANGIAPLGADNKVPAAYLPASGSYLGTWNATTNTPTITSGVGVNGQFYRVAVAGATNIDGITSWSIGDELRFNGTVWERIPNSSAVSSVNGEVGAVVLDYSDVGATPISHAGATGSAHGLATTSVNGFLSAADKTKLDGLTKVTSSSDTTAGRLVTAPWMGIGGDGILNNDWDGITQGGIYYNNTGAAVGVPITTFPIAVLHIRIGAVSAVQIAARSAVSDQIWVRRKTASTWQPWTELYHSGNQLSLGTTSSSAKTALSLTKADVGLSNVDNTTDLNKPISTATQTALDSKQASLGYTPVQQGTGIGQLGNTVKIGWNTTDLKATVDVTDLGNFAFQGWVTTNFAPLNSPEITGVPVVLDGTLQVGSSSGDYVRIRYDKTISINGGTYYSLLTTNNILDSISSTSTTSAAAPNSVKTAYDLANSKLSATPLFIELGRTDGVAQQSYLDFHTGSVVTDYDSRIIATGGSGSTAGGTLELIASSFTFTGGAIAGNGSGLTTLNANNLSSGTVPSARLTAATTSVAGIVQLSDSTSTTSSVLAATPTAVKAVADSVTTLKNTPSQTFQNLGTVSGAVSITAASGIHVIATVNGNTTWTFPSPSVTEVHALTLELTNGGAYTMTWPSGTRWAGGIAPTLTSSGTDILVFTKAGTANWRGYLSSKDNK